MLIPAIVGGFAGFKAVTSIFKEINAAAAGIDVVQKLTAGEKLTAFAANVSGKFTALKGSITGAWAALQAFTGLSTVGLVAGLGAVAVAIAGVYAVAKAADNANMEATRRYEQKTKEVAQAQKELSKTQTKSKNFESLISSYEKLSNVTNKTKEQQQEYNQVLKDLEKIDPNLIQYDENGSPVKVRINEVKRLREELKKAIEDQKKLLGDKLKEKAEASYDKYNSQPQQQKRGNLYQKVEDAKNKLAPINPATGIRQATMDANLIDSYLKGNEGAKKKIEEYRKNWEDLKKINKQANEAVAKDNIKVSNDRSAVIENQLGNIKSIEKAGADRKRAIENALKMDFSQFDNSGFEKINDQLTKFLSEGSDADVGKFSGLAAEVNQLSAAWQNGQITGKQYQQSIGQIAQQIHDMTGMDIEDAKKLLTIPEFDASQANTVLSELDQVKGNIESKISEILQSTSPQEKLRLAYELEQDPTVPQKVKDLIDELASDGEISEQDLKTILNMQAELKDEDLTNTIDKEIAKLGDMDEKEITQEVAIKFAAKVDSGADFEQYIEELTGSKELAVDIKIAMQTNDLDLLKSELKDLPQEKQIGIIVAAASSGQYTPEQIQNFINTLPPEVQTAIKANDQASSVINNVKNNVNNVPQSHNTNLNASDNASGKANTVTSSVKNIPQSHNTTIKAEDSASGVIGKVKGLIDSIPGMKTVKIVAQKVGDFVGGLFGGGGKSAKSVGDFSNVSDTPTESGDVSAMGTFSNVSSTPTESGGASATGEGAPSAGGQSSSQVSSRAIGDIDLTNPGTSTINTSSLSKVWDAIKRGIDLFKELNQRIDKVKDNLGILGEKLDMAVGKERVKLLKQQNTLYSQQASLTKTLYNKLNESQSQMTKQVKKYGFTIKNGFLDNYEETLSKLEKASEDAQKKLDDYNDKKSSKSKKKTSSSKKKTSKKKSITSKKKTTSSKTSSSSSSKTDAQQKALEKAAEKAKEKLEEAKKASDAFLNQDKEMQDCQQEWQKLQNEIKKNNDEIEKLEFEDKIYKQKNALESLNNTLSISNKELDKYGTLAERYQGAEKLKYLKLQSEELQKQVDYYKNMRAYNFSEREKYKTKLREYGVKFDTNGAMTNYASILNKYQDSYDLEKIKTWMDEYQDLYEDFKDYNNEIDETINKTQELDNQIKKMEFDNKFKSFANEVSNANQNITKLNNELDILDVKLRNATGKEKIDLLDQQISKWQELQKQQQIVLDNLNTELSGRQKELTTYGFKFDEKGNIINKDAELDRHKDDYMYEYIQDMVEQWEDLYNDKIPSAEKELIDYQNSIKDVRNEQLETISTIEDKLKDMYKKQIEDRTKLIEETRDKELEAIEKSKDARIKAINKVKEEYNRSNETDDYNKEFSEQQKVIDELNQKIALAQRDNSIEGKSRVDELLEQLTEEQKKLQEIVDNRTRELTNQLFDDQIDKIEEESDKTSEDIKNKAEEQIKALEEAWTDSKIAEAIKESLATGVFTGIDNEVIDLQDALLNFAVESGDAIGVLADKVKTELSESLKEAIQYMSQYDTIAKELEFNRFDAEAPYLKPEVYIKNNSEPNATDVKIDQVNIAIESKNGDPKAISEEIKKNIDTYFKDILSKS